MKLAGAVLVALSCAFAADIHEDLERAHKLIREQPEEAKAIVDRLLASSPDSSEVHGVNGDVAFRLGQFNLAEKEFKQAIKLNDNNAHAWLGLARVFRTASYFKTAALYIGKAHSIAPDDPEVLGAWATVRSGAENLDALRKYLETSTDISEKERAAILAYLKRREALPDTDRHARLVSPYEPATLHLEDALYSPQRIRGMALRIKVNGKSLQLLLDTGASGILVNTKPAAKAGLESIAPAVFSGIGDDKPIREGGFAIAETLEIGPVKFANYPVEISDRKSVADEDGLMGADVFAAFVVSLDFAARKLTLTPFPGVDPNAHGPAARWDRVIAEDKKDYTPVFRVGNHLLVLTTVDDSPPVLFLMDTGASLTLIDQDFARTVTKVRNDEFTKLKGVSGTVKNVYSADKFTLQFARLKQQNLDTVAFDMKPLSRDFGVQMSGILGFPVLSMLKIDIDYRNGLVRFRYKP